MVKFSDVFFTYSPKTPLSFAALKGINLEIKDGSFTALVGRTGCGKSTLVQHINALLNPVQGTVEVNGFLNVPEKKKRSKNVTELRRNVGLVFQFPEYQLFEETVEKDVAFAPKNFGATKEEAMEAAHKALEAVGLGPSFYERSPFELSGGEKRRVAIAGILAFKPSFLVVDEPTAGLDPQGAKEMMDLFQKIHDEGTTILLVTHDMNLVLDYCDTVVVMDDGKIAEVTTPQSLFGDPIERYSLETPILYQAIESFNAKGAGLDIEAIQDIDGLADEILRRRANR